MSLFAICSSDKSKIFVSDIRLRKIFCISQITHGSKTSTSTRKLEELISFPRSSLPTAVALIHAMITVYQCRRLLWSGWEGAKVHLLEGETKLRSFEEVSGPCMGIAGADPGFWNGGVNFSNNVIEPKPGWGVWGLCISKETRGLRKKGGGGVKIHPFHLPWIRAWIGVILKQSTWYLPHQQRENDSRKWTTRTALWRSY